MNEQEKGVAGRFHIIAGSFEKPGDEGAGGEHGNKGRQRGGRK